VDAEFIREKIFEQEIPYCEVCKSNPIFKSEQAKEKDEQEKSSLLDESQNENADESFNQFMSFFNERKSSGILKPDIVFFGEGLPEIYHKSINDDKAKCDLLIVIGSSLKVKPVANIPRKYLF
jgi:NAD-dependent SIR2 family protein deacetylase